MYTQTQWHRNTQIYWHTDTETHGHTQNIYRCAKRVQTLIKTWKDFLETDKISSNCQPQEHKVKQTYILSNELCWQAILFDKN